jgi:hypothetical protein
MTRAEALAAAAGIIAKSVPDIIALVEFLDIAGVKRLAAQLREISRARPVEVGGTPRPNVELWAKGSVR